MRGHLRKRYDGSWNIILDVGRRPDPKTGLLRRVQKWFTVRGTKRQAQNKLTELLHNANTGQVIEPSKMTLGEWLGEWLEAAIKPKRLRTYETYKSVITLHLKPKLGQLRLYELRATHLKEYYNETKLSPATLGQHHAILHSALKAAQQQDMVPRNVAALVVGKPRRAEGYDDVLKHCWEPEEAQKFLEKAKTADPQTAAFYALALGTGMRKAELCGLQWADLDFDRGTLAVVRQLVKPGKEPIFGPPKNGKSRTLHLSPQEVTLLRKHKKAQSELKLKYRTAYRDHGLVFAKEGPDFGAPLQINNLGQRAYLKLIEAAEVRWIKFHGLRHTCATLMLKAGAPVKVVSERLGHKKIEMTLNIYAHALPSMQQEAAAQLANVLHG